MNGAAGAARDIDGQTEKSNGDFGKSDIEGKAAMGSGERAGKRTSFKCARAHESIAKRNEFQLCAKAEFGNNLATRRKSSSSISMSRKVVE